MIPHGAKGAAFDYQTAILKKQARGYESFIDPGQLEVIRAPHEHDLMMDDVSLGVETVIGSISVEIKKDEESLSMTVQAPGAGGLVYVPAADGQQVETDSDSTAEYLEETTVGTTHYQVYQITEAGTFHFQVN